MIIYQFARGLPVDISVSRSFGIGLIATVIIIYVDKRRMTQCLLHNSLVTHSARTERTCKAILYIELSSYIYIRQSAMRSFYSCLIQKDIIQRISPLQFFSFFGYGRDADIMEAERRAISSSRLYDLEKSGHSYVTIRRFLASSGAIVSGIRAKQAAALFLRFPRSEFERLPVTAKQRGDTCALREVFYCIALCVFNRSGNYSTISPHRMRCTTTAWYLYPQSPMHNHARDDERIILRCHTSPCETHFGNESMSIMAFLKLACKKHVIKISIIIAWSQIKNKI